MAMRDILFRGKTKDGKWVVGSHFCLQHNDERTHVHHFIIPDGTPIPKDRSIGDIQVEVDEDSLGQFVGLHYKDGNPVFEGDIVRGRDVMDKHDIYLVCEYGVIERRVVTKGQWENTEVIDLVTIPCFYFRNPRTGECLFPCRDNEHEFMFDHAGNKYDDPELIRVIED